MTDDRSTTTLDSTPSGQDAATPGTETHPLAETGREAGQRAGQLVERGAEIGLQQADRGLNLAASGAETVADSIRRVSVDMETGQPQISEFASTAADQAEALANYLRETDVRQIIGNVENFARRQPLVVRWRGLSRWNGHIALHQGSRRQAGPEPIPGIRVSLGEWFQLRGRRHGHSPPRGQRRMVRDRPGRLRGGLRCRGWRTAAASARCWATSGARSARSSARRSTSPGSRSHLASSRMGRGAAMTAGGGALIYAGLLVVLIAIVLLLIDAGLDPWLAALIVGAAALAIGALVTSDGCPADPKHRDRPTTDG